MAVTPVLITGWEHGVATLVTSGGGLATTLTGSAISVQSTVKNTGVYALRINPTATITRVDYALATPTVGVGRMYIRFASFPTSNTVFFRWQVSVGNHFGIKFRQADSKLVARHLGVGDGNEYATALSLNTWYRIDVKVDISTGSPTVDFQVDGNAVTQSVFTQAASTFAAVGVGCSDNITMDTYYDDLVVSATSGDYPIGAGGTAALVPTADGIHVAGTNIMEDNAGTDIGVTTAWDKINSIPPSSTTYIRQASIGTGNYAEVLFEDLSPTHSAVIGAMAVLSYTSASTTTNNGGCIVSKDSFSSQTTVWGASGALSDYSDGSTADLWYKSALIAGVVDDTTVNALKARLGYSSDATPDPYWVDLMIEVAYVAGSPPAGGLITPVFGGLTSPVFSEGVIQ